MSQGAFPAEFPEGIIIMAQRRNIFTLIELLIVIAIIAILASMLLPALRNAREKAIELECAGKVKQIASATLMYASDFSGFGPSGDFLPNALFVSDERGGIAAYLGVPEEYCFYNSKYGIMPSIALCPKGARYGDANPYFGPYYTESARNMNNSYALNDYLVRDHSGNLKKVKNPSTRMLATTSGIDHWNNDGTAGGGGGYCYHRDQIAFRHGRKANLAFVDGHLESRKRDDIPLGPYSNYDKDYLFWKQDY